VKSIFYSSFIFYNVENVSLTLLTFKIYNAKCLPTKLKFHKSPFIFLLVLVKQALYE